MKVISRKQLPTQSNLFFKGLTSYIALDYFHAPGWLWGVVGCIFVLAAIGRIYAYAKEKETFINL